MDTVEYFLIPRCRGCYAATSNFEVVIQMEPMPLAGMFCSTLTAALTAPVFPLTWVQCHRCGLVQVLEDIPDSILFSHYNYASSTIPGLVRHFESFSEFLTARYSRDCSLQFLEIGCNDGVLLNRLPRRWQLKGVDLSDVSRIAASSQSHYDLYNLPFSVDLVRDNGLEGSIDVISGSNCLAHISDLKAVFEAVYLALRSRGEFWLEVHDLDALLNGSQWDTIYHEHRLEWSEQSLLRCLLPLGFSHVETHRLPLHGGLLRVCFRKESRFQFIAPNSDQTQPKFACLREAYESRYNTRAAKILREELRKGHRIAAYGAAGRANVYLNQLREIQFEYIVDESSLRLHKFLPRVGTPVVPPQVLEEKPVGYCLITAWNYSEDITRKNPGHSGQWLTAFEAN